MMNHTHLPCEGRSRPGTSWNHTEGRGGGTALSEGCSRCVPGSWFSGTGDDSLGEPGERA